LKGKFYRQPKNSKRTETRPLFKDNLHASTENTEENQTLQLNNSQSLYTTFIPEYLKILDGICDPSQSTFLAYRRRIRELRASLPQGIHDNEVCKFYEDNWERCYDDGQTENGTANSDHNTGGGSLPLSSYSTYTLFFAFIRSFPSSKQGKLTIYWIGCGWGEEICLIALLAKQFDFPIHITATEYEEVYISKVQAKIEKLGLTDLITVVQEDLYQVADIPADYDIIYTSASPEPCFSLKLLYLSLKSARAQYLLWNREQNDHVITADDHDNAPFINLIMDKVTIVMANLGRDNIEQHVEDRTIYAIKLGTHNTRTADMLAYLKENMLTKQYMDKFRKHFGTSEEPEYSSTEYQFIRDNIVAVNSDKEYTFDLRPFLYHKLNNTDITVSGSTRSEYHEKWSVKNGDAYRKVIMTEFWKDAIYQPALVIWDQQEVISLAWDNAEVDVNTNFSEHDILTFRPIQSRTQQRDALKKGRKRRSS